ncbi:MAG: hypothetical protein ONB24_11225 [candidate division KSB1 bacterium]|nr:hypothetical protein [candidate division KSB1 bacterium]
MAERFYEIVVDAPFLLTKGFLMGYMQGSGKSFKYFFHRRHNIRRETMGEIVKELLHLECQTHLCLPESAVDEFEKALANAFEQLHTSIKQKRLIKSASFSFSYHVYAEERVGPCKEIFRSLPPGVELRNFQPVELRANLPAGVAEYTTLNTFCYEGSGVAAGDFEGIMELYLRIKRHSLCDSFLVSEIDLQF